MIKDRVAQLLDKEMDRKSFLMHVAAGFVAVVGASTALKMLSDNTTVTPKATSGVTAFQQGYGGAPYGR